MIKKTMLCLSMSVFALGTAAMGAEPPTEAWTKQTRARIANLVSDEFAVREQAEKELVAEGPAVMPLLKKALEASEDAELSLRGRRILKTLALEGETDPNALASWAREEAVAKRYEMAAKVYAKAAKRYEARSEAASDENQKNTDIAHAKKARERQARAEKRAKVSSVTNSGARTVVINGGGQVQIQVGGLEIVEAGDDNNAEDGDW